MTRPEDTEQDPRGANLETLKAFAVPELAWIVKCRLEAAGIPAFVADEISHRGDLAPLLDGGTKLQVRAKDLARAIRVLKESPDSGATMDPS